MSTTESKHVQNHPCPGTCRKEIMEGDCCAPNTPNHGCEYYTNWLAMQKPEEKQQSPFGGQVDEIRITNKPKQPINY